MSILNQKQKVFGNIAALKTLTDGFPKLKVGSSFPSINNNGDSIAFLTDLIKSLIGYEELVRETVDTLVYSIKDIEGDVKKALKDELKSLVSCGVDPSIPAFIRSTNTGISFPVRKIDFANILLVDPNSVAGKLLYSDITTNLIDSSDFNTFLYQTIQNDGTVEYWGHTTSSQDILNIRFDSVDVSGINPNNTLNVKVNSIYDNKTLTELNNDYIDSISLFNTEAIVNNIVDTVFGSITSVLNKTRTMLQTDAKIGTIVDKIVNSTEDVIEDKVFTFTNAEIQKHEEIAALRKEGHQILEGADKIISKVPMDALTTFNNAIGSATTLEDKRSVVASNLDIMANYSAERSPSKVDIPTIKLNFIQQIINNLIRSIVNIVLSPKVVMIFMINFKIIYGPTASFTDAVEFMKKNKTLFHNIMKRVSKVIVKKLLTIALKKIAILVAQTAAKEEIEKAKSNLTQLLSLIGIPQSTLRLIKGF
jgi:hypothetical protein